MNLTLYAKDLSLSDLEDQFGLQVDTQKPFLTFPENQLSPLTEPEEQTLERVSRHYLITLLPI